MTERRNLFRAEALLNSAPKEYGSPLLYQPITVRASLLVLTLLFIAAGLFVYFATFKTTVAVRGNLSPENGNVKLYPPNGGIYRAITVTEGDRVRANQVLAQIDLQQYNGDGSDKTSASLGLYRQEVAHLQRKKIVARQIFEGTRRQLNAQARSIGEELALLEKQQSLLQERMALSDENLQSQQTLLAGNNISRALFNQHRNEHLGLRQQINALMAEIVARQNALSDVRFQLETLPIRLEEELLQHDSRLNQLQLQIRQTEEQRESAIIAPFAGTVTGITASTGDISNPRMPLMTITPRQSVLQATLYVPSRAIGTVETGQEVLLTYDAFPFQVYGNYGGRIVSISRTSVDPREHLFPVTSLQEPVYLVTVSLDRQFAAGTEVFPLQSGMLFTAEIVTAEMTILRYIFDPITKLIRKS